MINAVENPETGLSAQEMVAVVDENDNVIDRVTRAQMRREKLRHRATYIFVKNSQGQYYCQKRTMIKDYCPGYFEACSGGCVQADETYEDNAPRELEEEMGIKGIPLAFLRTFLYEDETVKVYGGIFTGEYDGDVTPQEEEVESVHMLTADEIRAGRANDGLEFKVTPDSLVALELVEEAAALV